MLKIVLDCEKFEKLKLGRIGIYIAVYDDAIRGLHQNKAIEFRNRENEHEKVVAVVKDIVYFPSFVDLCESVSLEECGYSTEEIAEEIFLSDHDGLINSELERTYGVAGLVFASAVFTCELAKSIAEFLYDAEAKELMKNRDGWICATGSERRIASSERTIARRFPYHHRLMIADLLGILDNRKKSAEEIAGKYNESAETVERILVEMAKCRAKVFFHSRYCD